MLEAVGILCCSLYGEKYFIVMTPGENEKSE